MLEKIVSIWGTLSVSASVAAELLVLLVVLCLAGGAFLLKYKD